MKKILVPTDFSDQATNALNFGTELAKMSGAELILLHVIEHPAGSSFSASGEVHAADPTEHVFILKLIEKIEKDFESIKSQSVFDQVKVSSLIKVGSPFNTVSDLINTDDIDLIVMGTKGATGLQEVLVGSNAEKVVRHAGCAVITLKNEAQTGAIKNIAFATNLSDGQESMIYNLMELQKILGATIHLVKINTPNNFQRDKHTRAQMQGFVKKYNLENYTLNIYNDAEEEDGIICFAEEKKVDMIAMATHGRTGIMHLLAGSIAEDIVNHSKRPVWTFKIG